MSGTSRAIEDVWAERLRRVEVDGYTADHDDTTQGELCDAAVAYLVDRNLWPPNPNPKILRRSLVTAAALLVAEIERLDRLEERRASS